jgi:pyruvate/2-oxoglutarate dehydrogenase complex dihydrolipoamide dehydrogenase (E3) component
MKLFKKQARIAVMGAGAIGSVIGGMLALNGHKVTLIAADPTWIISGSMACTSKVSGGIIW